MTEVLLIVDSSYSVKSYVQPYLNAVNEIINVQKELAPDSLLSFATFNHRPSWFCNRQQVSTLKEITSDNFKPEGLTALYDSLAGIIHRMISFQKTIKSFPPICIILTDGEDNTSSRVDARLCAMQIHIAKAQGYKFIFLGTTEKAVQIGREMGCQTCILYNTTETSLARIGGTIAKLFQQPIQKVDIDLRDITASFADMKM